MKYSPINLRAPHRDTGLGKALTDASTASAWTSTFPATGKDGKPTGRNAPDRTL